MNWWYYLDCLCFTVAAIHLAECWHHLYRLKNSLQWLKDGKLERPTRASTNCIYLLIPVYDEANVIQASIKYFSQFTTDHPEVRLYYISTQKEGKNGATIRALQALKGKYNFTWLHYPRTEGVKADQLNWAIQSIFNDEQIKDPQRTYFGIYDVDSRPEPSAVEAMLHAEELVYQQPAIYLENYRQLGVFQRVGALLQTKWELGRNLAILRENHHRHQQMRHILSLPPCTGHGLFLRSDLLQERAFFISSSLTEDLELGYRLAFSNIPITPLPEVDICEYAPTPSATIPQTSRWFSGEANLFHYYRQTKQTPFFTWLVLKRYYLTSKWAFGAPLLITALAVLITRYPITITMALLSIFLYLYIPIKWLYHFPLWTKYLGEKPNVVSLVLFGTIRPLFNSLGPLSYMLETLRGKKLVFVKTPKIGEGTQEREQKTAASENPTEIIPDALLTHIDCHK